MNASMLLFVLAACGGQSGENNKGGDRGTCDVESSAPLADVPEAERPDGLTDLVATYEELDGAWSGTLRCLDEADEAATFSLEVDEALVLQTYSGDACSADAVAVVGETVFTLTTATFDDSQALDTRMAAGSGAAYPILLSGTGVELAWSAEGALDSAIDKYRWHEGSSASDATCALVDIVHGEEE